MHDNLDLDLVNTPNLLPTPADDEALKKNISTFISRVLCKHVKFFKLSYEDMVKQHLQHRFYEEII